MQCHRSSRATLWRRREKERITADGFYFVKFGLSSNNKSRSTQQPKASLVRLAVTLYSRVQLNNNAMVLAERNSENVRNGRRSRGTSPTVQTESSSEEDGGSFSLVSLRILMVTVAAASRSRIYSLHGRNLYVPHRKKQGKEKRMRGIVHPVCYYRSRRYEIAILLPEIRKLVNF